MGFCQQTGADEVRQKSPGDPAYQRRDTARDDTAKTTSAEAHGADPTGDTGQEHHPHGLASGTGVGFHFFINPDVERGRSNHSVGKARQNSDLPGRRSDRVHHIV